MDKDDNVTVVEDKPKGRKKFDEPEVCPVCRGEGTLSGDFLDEPCTACEGEGVRWRY